MQHVWGRAEVYTGFWWGNRRETDHFEDTVVDGRIILRWIFKTLVRGRHGLGPSGSGKV